MEFKAVLLCDNIVKISVIIVNIITVWWFLAAVELSFEETDTHDGEDEKEQTTDHQNILHGWKSGKQSVDDQLQVFEPLDNS